MRIIIKGGIWKNTEDEILKAAVMKYGKNQWARVASLLTRKSAKQCKARWYEWLDPSIKKTEWAREEEEKLLHLAKLMPNQWRTIAPIVGRTAAQCMEHYERLLDAAAGDEGMEEDINDPRRLRAGEVDVAPETKPARPDAVDMDEEEKDMLQEARARLANTKGKKSKRKGRERMLEESKRLAAIEKRRELKAAGLVTNDFSLVQNRKRNREINYATEIPFQKQVPMGFFDVQEEEAHEQSKRMRITKEISVSDLEKGGGMDLNSENARIKHKEDKIMKNLLKSNAPEAIEKMSKQYDTSSSTLFKEFSMPQPMVNEKDLEEIKKIEKVISQSSASSTGIASALVSDYSSSSFATPLSYARSTALSSSAAYSGVSEEDSLVRNAKELRLLREATPMLVSQNQQDLLQKMQEFDQQSQSITQNQRAALLSTPLTSIPFSTPLRPAKTQDYTEGFTSVPSSSSASSKSLLKQLQSLPEPEYTYEISVPEVADEVEEEDNSRGTSKTIQDASAILSRQQYLEDRKIKEFHNMKSSVQTSVFSETTPLPRPTHLSFPPAAKSMLLSGQVSAQNEEEKINKMIENELYLLLLYEDFNYPSTPVEGLLKESKAAVSSISSMSKQERDKLLSLHTYKSRDLRQAESLVLEEVAKESEELREKKLSVLESILEEKIQAKLESDNRSKDHLIKEIKEIQTRLSKISKKNDKLQEKIAVVKTGYERRLSSIANILANVLTPQLTDLHQQIKYLEAARQREEEVGQTRISKLREQVKALEKKELEYNKEVLLIRNFAASVGISL